MNKQIIADMMVLRSAIDRVRDLHKGTQRFILDKDTLVCCECSGMNMTNEPVLTVLYPCPTIKTLDGIL